MLIQAGVGRKSNRKIFMCFDKLNSPIWMSFDQVPFSDATWVNRLLNVQIRDVFDNAHSKIGMR